MSMISKLSRLIGITIAAVILAACGGTTPPPTGPTSAPAPTIPPKVENLPAPITAGKISDNLPTYTCAADAFASYYTLEVMQQAAIDVKHGFHLAIVPFQLDNNKAYDISEDQRVGAMAAGQWDCLLTTLDSVALNGASGQITALVDESAGADQFWAKSNIATLNDLRGHSIAVDQDSVGEFFTYYVLNLAGITLDPRTGSTIVFKSSVGDAVSAFNGGQADAVSGWEPDIEGASKGGGRKLVGTDTLRVIVDVIVTARQSIASRADVVQKFHDAWFEALKMSSDNFDQFASDVAAWSHNDWSGVGKTSASKDLGSALDLIAQASLDSNRIAMEDLGIIQSRIDQAKRVWAAAGKNPADVAGSAIEPKFVLASAGKTELQTSKPLHNASFYMTARPSFTALSPDQADKAQTLAILPCRSFEFLPGRTELTPEAQQILSECVVPILKSSPDVYLTVLGSAAWPDGPDTEQTIRDFAMRRAQSVADYLVAQGLNRERLVLKSTVPPPERRHLGNDQEDQRKKDRFVQLTLILTGR